VSIFYVRKAPIYFILIRIVIFSGWRVKSKKIFIWRGKSYGLDQDGDDVINGIIKKGV